MALGSPSLLGAQEVVDRSALVEAAFQKAKAAVPSIAIDAIVCVEDQRQIALGDEASLSFPCELQELVEDEADAGMLVTLLLVEPLGAVPAYERDEPVIEKAGAIGLAVIGAAIDPGSELEEVERAKSASGPVSPSLAAYAPADSRTFRTEAARIRREEDTLRTSSRNEERFRERAREDREEERARQAEYSSVTNFLELANLQGYCPADGRPFLKRATEYATSPVQEDRVYGLWADDKRHALEPYLNDLSRCR